MKRNETTSRLVASKAGKVETFDMGFPWTGVRRRESPLTQAAGKGKK